MKLWEYTFGLCNFFTSWECDVRAFCVVYIFECSLLKKRNGYNVAGLVAYYYSIKCVYSLRDFFLFLEDWVVIKRLFFELLLVMVLTMKFEMSSAMIITYLKANGGGDVVTTLVLGVVWRFFLYRRCGIEWVGSWKVNAFLWGSDVFEIFWWWKIEWEIVELENFRLPLLRAYRIVDRGLQFIRLEYCE